MAKTRAILIDITRCIGCRSCEQACKEIHDFPRDTEATLSPTALTIVEDHGARFVRRLCMNCQDPACASACLVGALQKTALGPVTYDAAKCIGCRYCIVACPFGVPRYEWSKLVPFVKKCAMCYGRQAKGQPPACVEACPVQASIVGWRDDIVEEAQRRILLDSKYVKHIYGSQEAGGTSVFFISDVPFENLGFATRVPRPGDADSHRQRPGRRAHGSAAGRQPAGGSVLDHEPPQGCGPGGRAGDNGIHHHKDREEMSHVRKSISQGHGLASHCHRSFRGRNLCGLCTFLSRV